MNLFKEELNKVQEITYCPDTFIYDIIERIQDEWGPKSFYSLTSNLKKDIKK